MNALLAAGSRTGSPQPAAVASAAENRLEPAAAPPPPAGDAACPLPHTERASSPGAPAADAARPTGALAFLDLLRMAGEGAGAGAAEAARADEGDIGPGDAEEVGAGENVGLAAALFDPAAEHLRLNATALPRGGEKEEREAQSPAASLAATPAASVPPLLAIAASVVEEGDPARPSGRSAQAAALTSATPAAALPAAALPAAALPAAGPAASMAARRAELGGAPSLAPAGADDVRAGAQAATAGPTPTAASLSPAGELASPAAPAPRANDGADASLRLPNGAPAGWRQPLADALGDRLQLQLGRGSERAVIRLDPPMMGSVEIVVRHEAGSVQVQLTATHGEVLRQLHAIADGLRQDLVGRQYADVNVSVADGSRDPGGRQRQGSDGGRDGEHLPGRGLADDGHDESSTFTLA